jgi:hypothetical protein
MVVGLRSNFGLSLLLAAGTVVASALLAAVVAHRRRAAGRPWFAPVARVLAGGAVVVILVTTALPSRFAIESDGDLVLSLGRAGLGDWRQFFDDPVSLASIELVANVALYAPVAFTMVLGWYRLRSAVLPACLALSIGIEATQFLVLGRVGALDDVVLNVAGAGLGYGAAQLLIHFGSRWHISSKVGGGQA